VFGEAEDAEIFWCAVGGESADLIRLLSKLALLKKIEFRKKSIVAIVEIVFARGLFPAVESGGRGGFAEASTKRIVGVIGCCVDADFQKIAIIQINFTVNGIT